MLDESMSTDAASPPDEDTATIGSMVPDFFQDDEPALRSQTGWLEEHLELCDDFFARFLRIPESSFRDWRLDRGELPADRQDALRNFRRTVLYVLHFASMDEQRARTFLRHQVRVEGSGPRRHPRTPPWNGSCLKSYLEEGGPDILLDVEYWLEGFWAGDPFVF